MKINQVEVDRLLARHGIASGIGGSGSKAAATGGRIATVTVTHHGDEDVLCLMINEIHSDERCPLDETRALALVKEFQAKHAVPNDESFEHMLAKLLVKISAVYEDSGAGLLVFEGIHLHPSAYYVGDVSMYSDHPEHTPARLDSDSHDRRAAFSHRHGERVGFPK